MNRFKEFLREFWVPIVAFTLFFGGIIALATSKGYNIITVDGCEYIRTSRSTVHKANCKNH